MKIEHLHKYKCRIKSRETFEGREVKPEVKAIEGKEYELQASWMQNEDDLYPGEWAMSDSTRGGGKLFSDTEYEVLWISSGDLEILSEAA